jgi:hypothetical protein
VSRPRLGGILPANSRPSAIAIAGVGLLGLATVSCGSTGSVTSNSSSSHVETVAIEPTASSTPDSPATESSFHGPDWRFAFPTPSAGETCYTLEAPSGVPSPPTTVLNDCLVSSLVEMERFSPIVFSPTSGGIVVVGFLASGYEIGVVKQDGGASPSVQQVKGRAFAMTFAEGGDVIEITLKKDGVEVPCKVLNAQPVTLFADCGRSPAP